MLVMIFSYSRQYSDNAVKGVHVELTITVM